MVKQGQRVYMDSETCQQIIFKAKKINVYETKYNRLVLFVSIFIYCVVIFYYYDDDTRSKTEVKKKNQNLLDLPSFFFQIHFLIIIIMSGGLFCCLTLF